MIEQLVEQLRKDFEGFSEQTKCLTISTTSGNENCYLTPIRFNGKIVVIGCIVSATKFAVNVAVALESFVDYIFVDIEKKLSPKNIDNSIDTRNIFHPILDEIYDVTKIIPFKPNDLTVDAIFDKIIDKCMMIRDCTVGIVGLGNIGSKISLKLLESGADVCAMPRTHSYKEHCIVNSLNLIKHRGAIASISITDNIYKLLIKSDILITCSTSQIVFSKDIYPLLQKLSIILDVGKENIPKEISINLKNCFYCDITNQLINYISNRIKNNGISTNVFNESFKCESNFVKSGTLVNKEGIIYAIINGKINFFGKVDRNLKFQRFGYDQILRYREKYVV